jgi:hypothetical protein
VFGNDNEQMIIQYCEYLCFYQIINHVGHHSFNQASSLVPHSLAFFVKIAEIESGQATICNIGIVQARLILSVE